MSEHPRDRFDLLPDAAAEAAFLDAFDKGRLHHAWLLCGVGDQIKAVARMLTHGSRASTAAQTRASTVSWSPSASMITQRSGWAAAISRKPRRRRS